MARRAQHPTRPLRPRFFIFCEGETEEKYFEKLKATCYYCVRRKMEIKVERKKHHTHLSNLIHQANKQKQLHVDGDQFWIVGDLDTVTPEQYQSCRQTCEGSGYQLATSYPCLEYWFLLHMPDSSSGLINSDKVLQALRSLPEFEHYQKPYADRHDALFARLYIVQAVTQAKKTLKHLPADNHMQAHTRVHDLIAALDALQPD